MQPIFSNEESQKIDVKAIASGISGECLMENAGRAVVDQILKRWQPKEVVVLCGPGNNGGDGYIIARLLNEINWSVKVLTIIDPSQLEGDAKVASLKWTGDVVLLNEEQDYLHAELIIDCLYGTGLSRPLDKETVELINYYKSLKTKVVSVDLPSGVHGNTGEVLGTAIEADLTVTFCNLKRAHFLLPGKELCGEIVVVDIGIPKQIINQIDFLTFWNQPIAWINSFPIPQSNTHKYIRGHTFIIGGDRYSTGAARLAAEASLRIGAGAVSIIAERNALDVYAKHLTAVMLEPSEKLQSIIANTNLKSFVIGPGTGLGKYTESCLDKILESNSPCVIDADALSIIARKPDYFFPKLHADCILTPHEGEFTRMFDNSHDKLTSCQSSVAKTGANVVFKGSDTIIAAACGKKISINNNAAPWLATAGSGDVLGGLIAGLQSQGMPSFEAACAGVWLHGELGTKLGLGLISEDISKSLPKLLQDLFNIKPLSQKVSFN